MSRGKQISQQRRSDIIQDHQNGITKKDIAKKYALSISTVSRTISRYKNTGSNDDKPRSGRPRVSSIRQDRAILREIKKNPCLTATQLVENLFVVSSKRVSVCTVRRRLYEKNFHGRRPRKVPGLSKKNIKKRYKFALEHKNKDLDYWKSIIWSDEARFDTRNDNSRRFRWREPNKELQRNLLCHSFKSGNVSQMVWGCFRDKRLGPLHFIDGIMNRNVYISILEDNMLRFYNRYVTILSNLYILRNYCSFENGIFQQDNDPKHTSLAVRAWFEENDISKMEWPSQSPDLNPMEHVWARLKTNLEGKIFRNKEELKLALQEKWNAIEPQFLEKLVASMPHRMKAVIKSKGGATKY